MERELDKWEIAMQNMLNGTCSIEHITRAMLAQVSSGELDIIKAGLCIKFGNHMNWGEDEIEIEQTFIDASEIAEFRHQIKVNIPASLLKFVSDVCAFVAYCVDADENTAIEIYVLFTSSFVNGEVVLNIGDKQ